MTIVCSVVHDVLYPTELSTSHASDSPPTLISDDGVQRQQHFRGCVVNDVDVAIRTRHAARHFSPLYPFELPIGHTNDSSPT